MLALLGNPERDPRIVQVVGTNGKGTTAVALAAALEELGYSAGAYLSPHVLSYTERVMVRGEYVTEETFAAAMGEVIALADDNGVPATQFELLTAGALKLFRDFGLDCAVLEAGLGARHDATTAAAPEMVVLTNVGLDHTEYLGETVEEISVEKLASLATAHTLVLGTDDPRIVEVAREECDKTGARIVESADDVDTMFSSGRTALPPYAERNVRIGIRAAEVLTGESLNKDARERVERRTVGRLPARFERFEVRGVPVIVDGGHNVPGLDAVIRSVRSVYGDRPLGVVFGVLKDKDIVGMLSRLSDEVHTLVLTRPGNERAADPEWIGREHGPKDLGGRNARVETDAGDALAVAVTEMEKVDGVVLVTGSLYTAARVLGGLRAG
ncbi:MAG: Mur ligase family protein [Actinomycetota bacterium]|nr:Mur ligase family protein [Actinomycetota bacterium]